MLHKSALTHYTQEDNKDTNNATAAVTSYNLKVYRNLAKLDLSLSIQTPKNERFPS